MTKEIHGVTTVVLWDRDINEGELVEEELAFFTQDDDGTVWSLGEYPEELEGGKVIGAPSTWISGLADAQAGIHMPAEAQRGQGWYSQGFAPAIDFLDCAHVFTTGQTAAVPVNSYQNVLLTDEVSPPPASGGHQRKYHAPGVGIIQIDAVGERGRDVGTGGAPSTHRRLTGGGHRAGAPTGQAWSRANQPRPIRPDHTRPTLSEA